MLDGLDLGRDGYLGVVWCEAGWGYIRDFFFSRRTRI